jgi:hypothetical protein
MRPTHPLLNLSSYKNLPKRKNSYIILLIAKTLPRERRGSRNKNLQEVKKLLLQQLEWLERFEPASLGRLDEDTLEALEEAMAEAFILVRESGISREEKAKVSRLAELLRQEFKGQGGIQREIFNVSTLILNNGRFSLDDI